MADLGSYTNRPLTSNDWNYLKTQGYNSQQLGQTLNGYQVYETGPGQQMLRATTAPNTAAPGAPAKPAPVAAPAVPNVGQNSTYSYSSGSPLAQQTVQQTGAGGKTIQSSFRDALLGQLNTNPNNVKLTDPDLAPQARAYQDAQTRATSQLQSDLAEQGFAGGTNYSGAYDQELANARTTEAQNVGTFNAGLISQAQNQRLQTLLTSLGLGGNLIDSASSQAVQQGLGQADINLRAQLGKNQLGLGLLQALLGDRQTNNQLGLNAAIAGSNIDANSLRTFA